MRPTALSFSGILLALLCVGTSVSAAEYNPARTRPSGAEQVTAQRVIVKFRPSSRLSTQGTTARESAATADSTSRVNALANRMSLSVQGTRAISANLHAMEVVPAAGNETSAE